jgi:hypothetical protein
MKLFKIWHVYAILDMQAYEQSIKTNLKSPGTLIDWNLKNRIIIKKMHFFGSYYVHTIMVIIITKGEFDAHTVIF